MFRRAENAIEKGIENRVFTGASIGVWSAEEKIDFVGVYGTTESELKRWSVNEQTFFDLASLTKPFVVALCFMKLLDEGRVALTTRLDQFFDTKGDSKSQISIGDLLSHSSGLPAHRKFYEECERNCTHFVISQILGETLQYETNKSFIYSDLGYIILGEIIKKITGEELENYWFENIIKPLGLEKKLVFSNNNELTKLNCCLTRNIENPQLLHCGEVHDDNCRIMGGVAGHAGLFGNIEGVFSLTKEIFKIAKKRQNKIISDREAVVEFFDKRKNSTWVCGFDTPSPLYSSSGKYFSKKSIGHLGFTGTSFWVDLEKERIIILLTNRAYYENSLTEMKKFRPFFHDTIMESIG